MGAIAIAAQSSGSGSVVGSSTSCRVGPRDPVEVGALEGEEADAEDRQHAEDQPVGELRVGLTLAHRQPDHRDQHGDHENAEDRVNPRPFEPPGHARQPTAEFDPVQA
jgi:hypothetical protein